MDLSDVAKVSGGRLLRQIEDSFLLVVSPRQFVQMLERERRTDTWTRLLTLGICSAVFEVAVLSIGPIAASDWDNLRVFGISAFEGALVLMWAPAICLVARVMGVQSPLRVGAAYVLTFRFVFGVVLLILFAIFLHTEDYAFAFLKGIADWLFLAGLVILFPLAAARSARQRLGGLLLAVVASITCLNSIDTVLSKFHTGTNVSDHSLLADPIGDEIDDLHMQWAYASTGQPMAKFYASLTDLWGSRPINDSTLVGAPGLSADVSKVINWPVEFAALERTWIRDSTRLQKAESSATFRTTRRVVGLNRAMISAALSAGRAGVRFASSRKGIPLDAHSLPPTVFEMVTLYDAHLEALDAEIAAVREYESFEHVRSKLRSMGLIPVP